jgi:hypothetical protein
MKTARTRNPMFAAALLWGLTLVVGTDAAQTALSAEALGAADDPLPSWNDGPAKESVSSQDLRPLRALAEEKKLKRYLCVCLEPRTRKTQEIVILSFTKFLEALWNGEYQ